MHELVFLILLIDIAGDNFSLIGMIYFFKFIPYLLFGFFGGYLSDTFNNKNLMLISDLARAIITLFLCYLTYFGIADLLLLGLAGFSMTLFRIVFQPCFQASIPKIIEKNSLMAGNSLMQISEEIGAIIGPAFAGLLIAITNKSLIFAIDASTFLISFLLIAALDVVRDINKYQSKIISFKNLFSETIQSLKNITINDKLLYTIIISGFCILFVSSTLRYILPLYIKNNFTAGETIIGLMLSAISCGTVFGAILYNRFGQVSSLQRLLLFWSIYGIFLFVITLVHSQSYIIMLAFIIGMIGAWVDICLVTNIQTLSTNENMGKNFSIFSTIANTSEASSGLISGLLVKVTSVIFCANFFSSLIIAIPLIVLLLMNRIIKN